MTRESTYSLFAKGVVPDQLYGEINFMLNPNSISGNIMPFIEGCFGNVKTYATEKEAFDAFCQKMQGHGFTEEELRKAWSMACYNYHK